MSGLTKAGTKLVDAIVESLSLDDKLARAAYRDVAAVEAAAAQRALEGVETTARWRALSPDGLSCWCASPRRKDQRHGEICVRLRRTLGLAPSDAAPGEAGR